MFDRDPFTPDRIFCPGPTPVPRAAHVAAQESAAIYHRSEEFYRDFLRCTELLAPVFGSKGRPVILTCSGTGAMEATLVKLTEPGDEVVCVVGGKFGERWEQLARTYQCDVQAVKVEWGHVPTAADILAAIGRQKKTKAIFLQANETSTGAYYPVEALARELRKSFAGHLVFDSISSLGAHAMRMEDWGIDAVVAGSQKGFGIPPGLAFVALSERAWAQKSARPRFYFDLDKERKGQAEGRTAWTPATTLIYSLKAALEQMHQVGLERVVQHHTQLADAARAGVAAMGLSLFPQQPSNALTTPLVPAGIDGSKLVKRLRGRFGAFFAGGQDQLKGKIVRIAHLGFVSRFDLLDALAALEFGLAEEGYRHDLGAGVKAAMQSLSKG
jgi:aspartate aminotransferase-like enzyme